jgi:hypothetical protein
MAGVEGAEDIMTEAEDMMTGVEDMTRIDVMTEIKRKGLSSNYLTTNLQKGVTAMKKRNIVVNFLVLLMLIATFAACAATGTRESSGEYVDDSVITTKVKSLLAADDFLKSFQISIETYQGIVQLSGFVNSQKAVDKADEIVKSVKGVKSIKNNLIVK